MSIRTGVFIDAPHVHRTGGHGLDVHQLNAFVQRLTGCPVTCGNIYVDVLDDPEADARQANFAEAVHEQGYRVSYCEPGREPSPTRHGLHEDVLTRLSALDQVVIVGPGDETDDDDEILSLLDRCADRGAATVLIHFDRLSDTVRHSANWSINGLLVPGLRPMGPRIEGRTKLVPSKDWLQVDQVARGVCYSFSADRGFGFFRVMRDLSELGDLELYDTREEMSHYRSVFFHRSELPLHVQQAAETLLPSRELIFEFEIVEAKIQRGQDQFAARAITEARYGDHS